MVRILLCFARQYQHCHQRIKKHLLQQVNLLVLEQLNPEQVEVEIRWSFPKHDGRESELDEMWSYVTKKKTNVGYGMPLIIIVVKF